MSQEELPVPTEEIEDLIQGGHLSLRHRAEFANCSQYLCDGFRIYEGGTLHGYDFSCLKLASIVVASRILQRPFTPDEISSWFELDSAQKRLTNRHINTMANKVHGERIPDNSRLYAERWAKKLEISPPTIGVILDICDKIQSGEYALPNAVNSTWASVAIYAACRQTEIAVDRRTQRQIAELCKISEVSIRHKYAQLLPSLWPEDIEYIEEQANEIISYVYIVTNESFPEMIKFGTSTRPLDTWSTGRMGRYNPNHKYVVEWMFPCTNASSQDGVESTILRYLNQNADGGGFGREWFRIEVDALKEIIENNQTYLQNRRGNPSSEVQRQ
jgi:hypothetical protein